MQGQTAAQLGIWTIPIDYEAYPHIVEAIARAAPQCVMVAFRGMSRQFKKIVDPLIFEHVVVPDRDHECVRTIEGERGPFPTLIEGLDGPLPMVWREPTVPLDLSKLSPVRVIDYHRYVDGAMSNLWSHVSYGYSPSIAERTEGVGKSGNLVVRRFCNLPHEYDLGAGFDWYGGAHTYVDFFNLSAVNDHEFPFAYTPQDDIIVPTRVHHIFYDPLHPRTPDIVIQFGGRAPKHIVIFTAHSPREYPDSTPVVPAKDIKKGILGYVIEFFGRPEPYNKLSNEDAGDNDSSYNIVDRADNNDNGGNDGNHLLALNDHNSSLNDSDDSDDSEDPEDDPRNNAGYHYAYLVDPRNIGHRNSATFVGLTDIDRRLVGLPLTASDDDTINAIRAAMKSFECNESWRDDLVDDFVFLTHEQYRASVSERTYRLHTCDPETTIVPPPPLENHPCADPSPLATALPETKYRFLTVFMEEGARDIELRGPDGEDIGLDPLPTTTSGLEILQQESALVHPRVLEFRTEDDARGLCQSISNLRVVRQINKWCQPSAPTVVLFQFATSLDGSTDPDLVTYQHDAKNRVVINISYDPRRPEDTGLNPLKFSPNDAKELVIVFSQFDSWPLKKPLTALWNRDNSSTPKTVLDALVHTLGTEAATMLVTVVGVVEFCNTFNLLSSLDPTDFTAHLAERASNYSGSDEEREYESRHRGLRNRWRKPVSGLPKQLRFMTHTEYEAEVGAEVYQWETGVPPVEVFRRLR